MILTYIEEYKVATKQDIDGIILDFLPKVLDKNQKANKIRNIVYAMSKKDKTIENQIIKRKPKWVLRLSKQQNL